MSGKAYVRVRLYIDSTDIQVVNSGRLISPFLPSFWICRLSDLARTGWAYPLAHHYLSLYLSLFWCYDKSGETNVFRKPTATATGHLMARQAVT